MNAALNPTLNRLLRLCRMDRIWVRGEGSWLFDQSGRRFLDGYAQYGAVAFGHDAPLVKSAIRSALDEGEPAMVQPYRARHAEALAEKLVRAAPGMAQCVFTTSGAETVEAAIKLVRSRTSRPIILSTEGSFHGKTLGALAATGQRHHAEGFGPVPAGFERVSFGDGDALARKLERDGDRVAGFLLEPIQGERGVHPAPPGYLRRARELCSQYGVALILDEIQTGLGRTGQFFACQHEGVRPDLLLVAKALGGGFFPLGACLVSRAFWDERFALGHSSTFANNNIACRVGEAVLEEVARLLPEVARKGARLQAGLAELPRRYPRAVAAVRGRGLLGAVELRPIPADAGLFLSYLHHQGLYAYAVASTIAELASVLVLPTLGDSSVLRVSPPLTISDGEIERLLKGIASVCALLDRGAADRVARALGALDEGDAAVEEEPVYLPAPSHKVSGPCYAFLVHYTRPEDVVITDPSMARLAPAELQRFCSFTARMPPGVVVRPAPIRSATGAAAEGFIISVGMLPQEMQRRGRRRVEAQIARAVDLAASLGAKVVGLGGFTTPFSRRGRAVLGRGPAITTGNALTAGMAMRAIQSVAARRGKSIEGARVAVVGARGSVGALCAKLMARERPRRMVLVGNPESGTTQLARLADQLGCDPRAIEITTDLARLAGCEIVLSATGAARPVLDGAALRHGTIICDVARPADASPRVRARTDLTVIDGGLVALPDPGAHFGAGNLQGLPRGIQLACLSETILLALAGETRDRGIGDSVPLEEVDEVLALAGRHGFRLVEPPLDSLDAQLLRRTA